MKSMSALAARMGSINIALEVKVPDVNVNVNGAGGIGAQIQSAFNNNLKPFITNTLNSMKEAIKSEVLGQVK